MLIAAPVFTPNVITIPNNINAIAIGIIPGSGLEFGGSVIADIQPVRSDVPTTCEIKDFSLKRCFCAYITALLAFVPA